MWTSTKNLQLLKNVRKLSRMFLNQRVASSQAIQMAYNVYENKNTNIKEIPVVIMHGLFESKEIFHNTSKILMEKLSRKVYAVDLRNHGDSPRTETHTDQQISEDLHKFLTDHNISKVIVMGQGMGGRSMMFFTLHHPELVERGVIFDLAIPRGLKENIEVLLCMKTTDISLFKTTDECRHAVLHGLNDAAHRPELVNLIMNNIRRRETGGFYWATNVDVLVHNLRQIGSFMMYLGPMKPFQNPMMFFHGENSALINDQTWPVIHILFNNSEMHSFNNDQLPQINPAETFYDITLNFLRK